MWDDLHGAHTGESVSTYIAIKGEEFMLCGEEGGDLVYMCEGGETLCAKMLKCNAYSLT